MHSRECHLLYSKYAKLALISKLPLKLPRLIKYKLCITALPVIFIISSLSLCLSLSLSISLSLSFYVLTLSFSIYLSSLSLLLSLNLSHSLSLSLSVYLSLSHSLFLFLCQSLNSVLTLCLFLKNPCSSKFCNKMFAAVAPSRRQHIYLTTTSLWVTTTCEQRPAWIPNPSKTTTKYWPSTNHLENNDHF